MEITTVLDQIAQLFADDKAGDWPYLGGRHAFHRASDLVVTGDVAFAQPNPGELVPLTDIPAGRYPVYLEVVEPDAAKRATYAMPASWVNLVVIPLASPQAIAEALAAHRLEDVYGDYQPLGPQGALWDAAASTLAWSSEFAARVKSELATGTVAGRLPNVVEVPAASGDGAMCIAFHSGVESGCGRGTALYDDEGGLVCVVLDEYS
ncbi:hypothetical protein [Kitasatospora kifunensis]|uniref:DUF4241 domain-containing protein n=1 Tax=Kitasatospora kifunensis TaxID=58351 RepID=A0A7W7R6E2_KITKI|nr:hypothetical protein [Kitasatospora kifunensis]MBB4926211.1 hypothetical protein [Kitasatospora kifunensis]